MCFGVGLLTFYLQKNKNEISMLLPKKPFKITGPLLGRLSTDEPVDFEK